MQTRRPNVEVVVEFVRPDGVPEGWERTALWDKAAAIPGLSVHCDAGGALARRSGATTSGQFLAFDEAGTIVFSGGITPGRGRRGPAAGHHILRALLAGEGTEAREAPVFGCPLFGPETCGLANEECKSCR